MLFSLQNKYNFQSWLKNYITETARWAFVMNGKNIHLFLWTITRWTMMQIDGVKSVRFHRVFEPKQPNAVGLNAL